MKNKQEKYTGKFIQRDYNLYKDIQDVLIRCEGLLPIQVILKPLKVKEKRILKEDHYREKFIQKEKLKVLIDCLQYIKTEDPYWNSKERKLEYKIQESFNGIYKFFMSLPTSEVHWHYKYPEENFGTYIGELQEKDSLNFIWWGSSGERNYKFSIDKSTGEIEKGLNDNNKLYYHNNIRLIDEIYIQKQDLDLVEKFAELVYPNIEIYEEEGE